MEKTDTQQSSGGKVREVTNKPSKQNSNANLYDKAGASGSSSGSSGGAASTGYNKESM